jgi:hypothetical protein
LLWALADPLSLRRSLFAFGLHARPRGVRLDPPNYDPLICWASCVADWALDLSGGSRSPLSTRQISAFECRGRDSNPHGAFAPEDFKSVTALVTIGRNQSQSSISKPYSTFHLPSKDPFRPFQLDRTAKVEPKSKPIRPGPIRIGFERKIPVNGGSNSRAAPRACEAAKCLVVVPTTPMKIQNACRGAE